MDDQNLVIATTWVMLVYFLLHVFARKFDPFAPVWLFLLGYAQVYIVQAMSYHEWAVGVRGPELVTAASFRTLWGFVWFLSVYQIRNRSQVRFCASSAASEMVACVDCYCVAYSHRLGHVLRGYCYSRGNAGD